MIEFREFQKQYNGLLDAGSEKKMTTNSNMKHTATMKYMDGRISVQVDEEYCTVNWLFAGKNKEVYNYGHMDIEMYINGTWLPYWETHSPSRKPPTQMMPCILKLFHKVGMIHDEEVE